MARSPRYCWRMDVSNVIVEPERHEWVSKASLGALSLLAANAGLLLLYFAYDLSLFQLVVVLWVECFWIGLYSAIKLLTASIIGNPYENKYVHVTRGSSFLLSVIAIFFVTAEFIAIFTGVAGAFRTNADPVGFRRRRTEYQAGTNTRAGVRMCVVAVRPFPLDVFVENDGAVLD